MSVRGVGKESGRYLNRSLYASLSLSMYLSLFLMCYVSLSLSLYLYVRATNVKTREDRALPSQPIFIV